MIESKVTDNVIPIDAPRARRAPPTTQADRVLALVRAMPIFRGPTGLVRVKSDRALPITSPAFAEEVRAAWCEQYPDTTLGDGPIKRALATLRADKSIPETPLVPPPPKPRPVASDPREQLRDSLAVDKSGEVKDCLANVMSILSLDPEWKDVPAFDAFREGPVLLRTPPQRSQDRVPDIAPGSDWTEQDSTRTAAWIAEAYGANVSSRTVTEAMMAIAQRRIVHPARDYIDGLRGTWDEIARVDRFFSTYAGATESDYTAGVARVLFLSAIARIRRPGCKVDTIPILEGDQGIFKSTLVSALFSPWFSDTPLPIGDKDAYQQLRGVWGYELGELASFKGRDATRIKSFASSPADNYRPSFEKRNRAVPRQCVFIGTTNEKHYLEDATGARRFLPVKVTRIDLDALRRDRDQLWAEADARFTNGEPWWPSKELERQSAEEAEERYVEDSWEEPIRAWLANPVRVHVVDGETSTETLDANHGFTMAVILELAVRVPIDRQDKKAQDRAQKILHRAGWRRDKNPVRIDEKRVRLWRPGRGAQ